MKRRTVTTRRLAWSGAAGAMVVAVLATVGVTSQAKAAVDPWGEKARFISIAKRSQCGTIGYTAEGYMVDASGKRIPDSTWHKWDGNIRSSDYLICKDKAVFAWDPANASAEIELTVYTGDHVEVSKIFRGDKNVCVLYDGDGDFHTTESSDGYGGSGECTAN